MIILKDGKYVPEKVGLKAIQRDGFDYELTLMLDIDSNHNCSASKDRTGIFRSSENSDFRISPKTGAVIRKWLEGGVVEVMEVKEDKAAVRKAILDCATVGQLKRLYDDLVPVDEEIRKLVILQRDILQTKTMSSNGTQ